MHLLQYLTVPWIQFWVWHIQTDGKYNVGYLKSFFNHNCYIALLSWIKLGLFLPSTPSSQHDIKRVCIPMHDKWALDHDGTGWDICGCADKLVDDQVPVVHTLKKLSIGMPDNHSLPILPTLSGMISHGSHSEAYRTIACSSIWMLLAQQWTDSPHWSQLLSVLVGNHGQCSTAKGAGAHAVSSLHQQLKDGKALSVRNIRKKVNYIFTFRNLKYMSGNACIDQNSIKKYQ